MSETIFCPACMCEMPWKSTQCPDCGQSITAQKATNDEARLWIKGISETYSITGWEYEKNMLVEALTAHPHNPNTMSPSLIIDEYELPLALTTGRMETKDFLVAVTDQRILFLSGNTLKAWPLVKITEISCVTNDEQLARIIIKRGKNSNIITAVPSKHAPQICSIIADSISPEQLKQTSPPQKVRIKRKKESTVVAQAFSDVDAQPTPGMHAKSRQARSQQEMIGLCKGIIADGRVCEAEASFLLNWFTANPEAASCWPGSQLAARLAEIWQDNQATPEELAALQELLKELTGLGNKALAELPHNFSSKLPLDQPEPVVTITGKSFCFTGKMAYAPRNVCEEAVFNLGGSACSRIVTSLDYLVIGLISSRDWKHSSHGTKILKALEYKEKGHPIAIISEDCWVRSLDI